MSDPSSTIEPDTGVDRSAAGPDDEPVEGAKRRRPKRRMRKRDHLKRSLYVLLFLLIFNHLVLPQLGGARRAFHLLSDVNPLPPALALWASIGAPRAYS